MSRQSAFRGLVLLVGVLLFTFTAALYDGFVHATSVADEATLENERGLVDNHIAASMRTMAAAARVQLTWDDAVRHVGGQDRNQDAGRIDAKWADPFIGEFLWSNLHAEYLYLIRPDGSLLRAWDHGKPATINRFQPVFAHIRDQLKVMAANRTVFGSPAGYRKLEDTIWPVDENGKALSRWSWQLGMVDGAPAYFAVISIVPDDNINLLRRTPNNVIAVKLIDKQLMATFANDLRLNDMQFSLGAGVGSGRNATELRDEHNAVIGTLNWQPNKLGPLVMRRTVPLLGAYLAFFMMVLVGGFFVIRQALNLARAYAAGEARAQRSAMHDPMLGLPNRTMVMQRMNRNLAELHDHASSVPLFVAYIDLDHFKSINDTIGHHVGDALLFEVVRRLRAILQDGDLLGRLASDEFVILHRDVGARETADALGASIMSAFTEPFKIMGHSLAVTASCGIAWAPGHAGDATELLRLADIALFRAKQRGRGRYRCFTDDMNSTIRWRQDMEIELRRAIAGNGLEMVYQPIVQISDRKIVCFEALLRWKHPDRGEISPAVFVPLAENCGLMPQLGEWVLRRVFQDSAEFGSTEISINLSPLQLSARDFLSQLRLLAVETGIIPRNFVFEITEGVLMDSSDRMLSVLGELRDMGFRIALDDFGTGYSSLAYLRSFQFDRIKVDRSFVQGIENDLDAQAILKTIVSLGRTLRMKVIAEGVETPLQQQLVATSGCELVQGHLHWRALEVNRAAALVNGRLRLTDIREDVAA